MGDAYAGTVENADAEEEIDEFTKGPERIGAPGKVLRGEIADLTEEVVETQGRTKSGSSSGSREASPTRSATALGSSSCPCR